MSQNTYTNNNDDLNSPLNWEWTTMTPGKKFVLDKDKLGKLEVYRDGKLILSSSNLVDWLIRDKGNTLKVYIA